MYRVKVVHTLLDEAEAGGTRKQAFVRLIQAFLHWRGVLARAARWLRLRDNISAGRCLGKRLRRNGRRGTNYEGRRRAASTRAIRTRRASSGVPTGSLKSSRAVSPPVSVSRRRSSPSGSIPTIRQPA